MIFRFPTTNTNPLFADLCNLTIFQSLVDWLDLIENFENSVKCVFRDLYNYRDRLFSVFLTEVNVELSSSKCNPPTSINAGVVGLIP